MTKYQDILVKLLELKEKEEILGAQVPHKVTYNGGEIKCWQEHPMTKENGLIQRLSPESHTSWIDFPAA